MYTFRNEASRTGFYFFEFRHETLRKRKEKTSETICLGVHLKVYDKSRYIYLFFTIFFKNMNENEFQRDNNIKYLLFKLTNSNKKK